MSELQKVTDEELQEAMDGEFDGIELWTVVQELLKLRKLEVCVQTCKNNHKYYANSHEYPCPWCQVDKYMNLTELLKAELPEFIPIDDIDLTIKPRKKGEILVKLQKGRGTQTGEILEAINLVEISEYAPCPFCGHTDPKTWWDDEENREGFNIKCCSIEISCVFKHEALAHWNQRDDSLPFDVANQNSILQLKNEYLKEIVVESRVPNYCTCEACIANGMVETRKNKRIVLREELDIELKNKVEEIYG